MNTANGSVHPPAKAWLTVFILLLFYVLAMLDRHIMAMLVDPIQEDLGVDDMRMGLLLGFSFAIFYSICGLPMGWLVDTKERRKVVFVGVSLWSLATAACGLAQNYIQLFISRMMVGVGEATLAPAAFSMLSDAFPRRRVSLAIAVYTLGALIGGALAMGGGGLIIEFATGYDALRLPLVGELRPWQLVFFLAGLPGLVFVFAIFFVPEPVRQGHTQGTKADDIPGWGAMAQFIKRDLRFWICMVITFALMNMVLNGVILWQPSHISRYFEWKPSQYGPMLGLVIIGAAIPGQIFSGWMIDRMVANGRHDAHLRYYIFAILIGGPMTVIAFLATNVWVYYIFLCGFFFFIVPFNGVAAAAIQLTTPNRLRGRMSATYMFITNFVGFGIGPTLVAAIAQYVIRDQVRLGLSLALMVGSCAVIALISALMGLRSMSRAMERALEPTEGAPKDATRQMP